MVATRQLTDGRNISCILAHSRMGIADSFLSLSCNLRKRLLTMIVAADHLALLVVGELWASPLIGARARPTESANFDRKISAGANTTIMTSCPTRSFTIAAALVLPETF
jgi:hypothetical protein